MWNQKASWLCLFASVKSWYATGLRLSKISPLAIAPNVVYRPEHMWNILNRTKNRPSHLEAMEIIATKREINSINSNVTVLNENTNLKDETLGNEFDIMYCLASSNTSCTYVRGSSGVLPKRWNHEDWEVPETCWEPMFRTRLRSSGNSTWNAVLHVHRKSDS